MDLERLAVRERGAASGLAAGTTVALAAATVAGAVLDSEWPLAAATRVQALELSERAQRMAGEDADAFAAAEQALSGSGDLGAALGRAAQLPLELAEVASDVATLASDASRHIEANRRADLVAATILAAGAANALAHLVLINLGVGERDPRRTAASQTARLADMAVRLAIGDGV